VGGLSTGISPCVLPVLPAIFLAGGAQSARASASVPANTGSLAVAANPKQSLGRRPYLVVAGLVVSFSVFTLLGSLILSAVLAGGLPDRLHRAGPARDDRRGDYTGTESLIRQLLTAANPTAELPPVTQVGDTTPTDPQQTPATYLGAARAQNFAGDVPLAEGVQTFPAPTTAPDDEFTLSGTWSITKESISSLGNAGIGLTFIADEVYLEVGGTGTVTATVDGTTTSYQVSGAPNIYTLVNRPSHSPDSLQVSLSPGLTAYSFTFG
jgi:F0F1-type ATP synthase membrane subunit c/vacuolar-type H+-ATPase subunit K